jgi:hypothetical protein
VFGLKCAAVTHGRIVPCKAPPSQLENIR